jgi:hypothetical protein
LNSCLQQIRLFFQIESCEDSLEEFRSGLSTRLDEFRGPLSLPNPLQELTDDIIEPEHKLELDPGDTNREFLADAAKETKTVKKK